MQQQTLTIVDRPMTPDLLIAIGGLGQLTSTPDDFRPDGAWVNEYRIYACQGYVASGNMNVGVLRLERTPTGDGFLLRCRQRIVDDEGRTETLDAWVRCRSDEIATPVEWRVLSRFEARSGNEIRSLGGEVSGSLAGQRLEVAHPPASRTTELSRPLASDWGLFEALQRLSPGPPPPAGFDVLEGLELLRTEQRLVHRGEYRPSPEAGLPPLVWYHRIGRGALPWEYWLDDRRRLLIAATNGRAYVLDDRAGEATSFRVQEIRDRKAGR